MHKGFIDICSYIYLAIYQLFLTIFLLFTSHRLVICCTLLTEHALNRQKATVFFFTPIWRKHEINEEAGTTTSHSMNASSLTFKFTLFLQFFESLGCYKDADFTLTFLICILVPGQWLNHCLTQWVIAIARELQWLLKWITPPP